MVEPSRAQARQWHPRVVEIGPPRKLCFYRRRKAFTVALLETMIVSFRPACREAWKGLASSQGRNPSLSNHSLCPRV